MGKLRDLANKFLSLFKRNTDDPLLKEFYKKYKLHLLALPREDSKIGDLYIFDSHDILPPSRIASYLDPAPDLQLINSKIESGKMADLSGKFSNKIDANVGVNLFSGFLIAIGAGAIIGK